MKTLFWVIGIFALAVGLVLAARYNDGYALVVMPPYRIEISLNLLVILLIGGTIVLYSALRLLYRTVRLPARVREYRLARHRAHARSALMDALHAWFAGDHAAAEAAALQSLDAGEHPRLAGIVAARAAHALGAYERRDAHLMRAARAAPADDALLAATRDELMLGQQRTKASPVALEDRRAESAQTGGALLDVQGADPRSAGAAARACLAEDSPAGARTVIESALAHSWSRGLVLLYARCAEDDPQAAIEHAERWLADHPDDAALRLTLGELCAQAGWWERAAVHLTASLSHEPTAAAHLAAARVHEALGAAEAARRHFDAALDLALADAAARDLERDPPRVQDAAGAAAGVKASE